MTMYAMMYLWDPLRSSFSSESNRIESMNFSCLPQGTRPATCCQALAEKLRAAGAEVSLEWPVSQVSAKYADFCLWRWCQDGVKMVSRWCQDGVKVVSRWCQDGVYCVFSTCLTQTNRLDEPSIDLPGLYIQTTSGSLCTFPLAHSEKERSRSWSNKPAAAIGLTRWTALIRAADSNKKLMQDDLHWFMSSLCHLASVSFHWPRPTLRQCLGHCILLISLLFMSPQMSKVILQTARVLLLPFKHIVFRLWPTLQRRDFSALHECWPSGATKMCLDPSNSVAQPLEILLQHWASLSSAYGLRLRKSPTALVRRCQGSEIVSPIRWP